MLSLSVLPATLDFFLFFLPLALLSVFDVLRSSGIMQCFLLLVPFDVETEAVSVSSRLEMFEYLRLAFDLLYNLKT